MKKILLLSFLSCLLALCSLAQTKKEEDEMNVDLPDETEETDLVKPGQFQMETSFLLNGYKSERKSYIGQGMLRYGVSKILEVRALVEDGRGRDRYLTNTVQSTYPLAVSGKLVLLKDKVHLPDITFVTYLKLPFTSHTKEQQRYWSPIFLGAFQNKFGDKWKLEYNGGIQQEAFSKDWFWLANASLHYKIVKRLEVFGEYYAQYQQSEAPQHNAGGGLAYEIGNAIEVYTAAGSTIFYDDSNFFINGGIAFRIPSK